MSEPDTPTPAAAVDRLNAQADVAESFSLRRRVAQSAVREGYRGDHIQWAFERAGQIGATPGWGAAFDHADAQGNPDPGFDDAVITDTAITARVQQMLAEETP